MRRLVKKIDITDEAGNVLRREDKAEIIYEMKDRVVVAYDGGHVWATVLYPSDGSRYKVRFDAEDGTPDFGTEMWISPAAIVKQADDGRIDKPGKIKHIEPDGKGYKIKPGKRPQPEERVLVGAERINRDRLELRRQLGLSADDVLKEFGE